MIGTPSGSFLRSKVHSWRVSRFSQNSAELPGRLNWSIPRHVDKNGTGAITFVLTLRVYALWYSRPRRMRTDKHTDPDLPCWRHQMPDDLYFLTWLVDSPNLPAYKSRRDEAMLLTYTLRDPSARNLGTCSVRPSRPWVEQQESARFWPVVVDPESSRRCS